jgi:hypothetical protein
MNDWETFCDTCYFDLWRVRRKEDQGFNDGYHLQHGEEAKALVELLNRLERERDEAIRARDVALKVAHTYDEAHTKACESWAQAERERDEAQAEVQRLTNLEIARQVNKENK